MAADSDGGLKVREDSGGGDLRKRERRRVVVTTETVVITCLGDLQDPAFPGRFRTVLRSLRGLLCSGTNERLRVSKVEPWNSVRVTFTIPAQAAQRLRALAQGGDPTLARLGILSVQLQPDQVISVRVGRSSAGDNPAPPAHPATIGSTAGPSVTMRSPNVVAPPPGAAPQLLPPPPPPAGAAVPTATPKPPHVFPFASMTHAAREAQVSGVYPPPPYPGGQPSPLLVNLLQTDPPTIQPPKPNPNAMVGVRLKSGPSSEEGGGGAFAAVRPRYQPGGMVPPPPAYRPPAAPVQQPPPKEEPPDQETTTSTGKRRQFLINPLTGVLEPMSSSSSESSGSSGEEDEGRTEGDDDRAARRQRNVPNSPRRQDRFAEEDCDAGPKPLAVSSAPSTPAPSVASEPQEKIKLRLKIEKPPPEMPVASSATIGYKVDFVKAPSSVVGGSNGTTNTSSSGNVGSSNSLAGVGGSSGVAGPPSNPGSGSSTPVEEPRVPPLHISLRGRNAAVVVGSRKEKKREGKNRIKTKKLCSSLEEAPSPSPEGAGGGIKPPAVGGGKPKITSKNSTRDESSGDPSAPGAPPLNLLPPARNNFPSEAEVASILRSMPPTAPGHKGLLESEEKKKRESKKRLYPRERGLVAATRVEEKRGRKCSSSSTTGSSVGASLLKSVVKSAAKEARIFSAAARLKASANINGRTDPFQGSGLLKNSRSSSGEGCDYRPKVNCVFGPKAGGTPAGQDLSSRYPGANGAQPSQAPKKPESITTVGCVTVAPDSSVPVSKATTGSGLPVTELDVSETKLKARLLQEEKEVGGGGGGKEGGGSGGGGGEDSGIESMDALSEKSPNQGESPSGKDDPPLASSGGGGTVGGGASKLGEGSKRGPSPQLKGGGPPAGGEKSQGEEEEEDLEEARGRRAAEASSPEEVVPVRLTPALYTYSNPERTQALRDSDSPSPPHNTEGGMFSPRGVVRSLSSSSSSGSGSKSLLEQLLIEIPVENPSERRTRRGHHLPTRLSHNRSPDRLSPPSKRTRKASESSTASHEDPPTPRPNKRKCSENAAELIKACMGLEEGGGNSGAAKRDAPSPANSTASSSSGKNQPKQRKGTLSHLDSESSEDEGGGHHQDGGGKPPAPQPGGPGRSKSEDTPSSRLRVAKEEESSRSSPRRGIVMARRSVRQTSSSHSPVGRSREQQPQPPSGTAQSQLPGSTTPAKAAKQPQPGPAQQPPAAPTGATRESQRRKTRSLASSDFVYFLGEGAGGDGGGSGRKRRRSSRDSK